MANKPITFEFLADVSDYLRSVKGMEVSTEDLADALNAVTKDAPELERKLSKAMRDAEKDVESLERAIRDLPKATDKAADSAKKDFDKIGDEARDAGREAGSEFASNLSEAVSSGDIGDVVTDTLGGLVAGIQGAFAVPAAAILGTAALGINIWKQRWEEANAEIKASTENAWDYILGTIQDRVGKAQAAFDSFTKESIIQGELQRLWNEDPQGMRGLVEAAQNLGLNLWDVVRARAGDQEAAARVLGVMDSQVDTQQEVRGLTQEEKVDRATVNELLGRGKTKWDEIKGTVDAYNAVQGEADSKLRGGMLAALQQSKSEADQTLAKLREIRDLQFPGKIIRVDIQTRAEGPAAQYIGKYIR